MIIDKLNSFFSILKHPMNKKHKLNAVGRIFWWKINQLFFHIPAIVTFDNQIKCICPPESACGSLVVYCCYYEYPEMIFLEKTLKPDSVFVDVGANIGIYTLIASSKIRKGRIYSFEPIPAVQNTLYQNIRINHLEDKVTVVNKVVSDKTGQERFVIHDISEYSHISSNQGSKSILIDSVKLDDFCKNQRIDHIDIIKIDVEGAELKVLKGMENALKMGKVRFLIAELNSRNSSYGGNSNQVIDYLKKFKYSIFKIDDELGIKEIEEVDNNQTFNIIAFLKKDMVEVKKHLKT